MKMFKIYEDKNEFREDYPDIRIAKGPFISRKAGEEYLDDSIPGVRA